MVGMGKIAVDEAYLKETGATGIYADGYYPHNIHFLLVSAQMAGDGKTVIDAAQRTGFPTWSRPTGIIRSASHWVRSYSWPAGQLDRAEAVFQASLKRTPNNGWALYGLREVYEKRGDKSAARAVEERLTRTWAGDRRRLDLARL
jgi:Tetratricopeptide repeat